MGCPLTFHNDMLVCVPAVVCSAKPAICLCDDSRRRWDRSLRLRCCGLDCPPRGFQCARVDIDLRALHLTELCVCFCGTPRLACGTLRDEARDIGLYCPVGALSDLLCGTGRGMPCLPLRLYGGASGCGALTRARDLQSERAWQRNTVSAG